MKKHFRILHLICSFFILFFASCINHDYDLTDENLDKNVVLSADGINVPVGNIDKIFIFKELTKSYSEIKEDANGILYVEYPGELNDIVIPEYEIPDIETVQTNKRAINHPWGELEIPIPNGKYALLDDGEIISYDINEPKFTNEGWTVVPAAVEFDICTLNVSFQLDGMDKLEGNADLILSLTFPDNFTVKEGGQSMTGGTITRKVTFTGSGTYNVAGIAVKSYRYVGEGRESDLIFQLELEVTNNLRIKANNAPTFRLTLNTDNENLDLNSMKGAVTGLESLEGSIDNFGDLNNSFAGSTFEFANPSLLLSLNTNIGADMRVDIENLDAHNGQALSLKGNEGLFFGKNVAKPISYYLAPNIDNPPANVLTRKFALNELFKTTNGTIPEAIDYRLTLNVNEPNAEIRYHNLLLEGDYTFKLPFSFNNLSIHIDVEPISIGDEDLDDLLFQNVKEKMSIYADTINVQVEKAGDLTIIATIEMLDVDKQIINVPGVAKPSLNLHKGINDKFAIDISKSYLEHMKNAKYLGFSFTLKGQNLSITPNDYIEIRGLRIVSDGGVHFELDF